MVSAPCEVVCHSGATADCPQVSEYLSVLPSTGPVLQCSAPEESVPWCFSEEMRFSFPLRFLVPGVALF